MSKVDIVKIDRDAPDRRERMQNMGVLAFVARTEGDVAASVIVESGRDTFVMLVEGDIAAVFQFWVEPHVAMCFDREGPAARTIRLFDLIRAAMQVQGISPLVFVERASPLNAIAGKRMNKIQDRDCYRMT